MNPESWEAIASVVTAITVVVLAVITYHYARSANRQRVAPHLTVAGDSFLACTQMALPETQMQNPKDNLPGNRPNAVAQPHESSANIAGESFDVNENDVRDQGRPDTEATGAARTAS